MVKDRHDFEDYPPEMRKDETDINVRAYFALMDENKLKEYKPTWTDEQVMEWDGNFRNDGSLMLICSERDVEIDEYRQVLEQYLEFQRQAS